MSLLLFVFWSVSSLSWAQTPAPQCLDLFRTPTVSEALGVPQKADYELQQYMEQKLYPEALRRSKDLNLVNVAYRLEKFIVDSLQNDKLIGFPRYLSQGTTEVYVVTLASGIKAIFKPEPQYWVIDSKKENRYLSNAAAEHAAYRVSRILGLDLVPPTVLREVDGKMGSLQVFVQGDQVSLAALEGAGREPRRLVQQASDLMAFDYLIRNADRVEKNIMVQGSHLWAIDNGSSFHPNSVRLSKPRLEDVPVPQLSLAFIASLEATTPGILREVLKDYPDQKVVEELIERRQNLLNLIPEQRLGSQ